MIITFSPQVKLPDSDYLFVKAKGDILYVKYEDKEEEYDFTLMGEGELQSVESSNISIEPLFKAKRTETDLYITIYRPIPPTNDRSVSFPEDIDTSKYDLSEYEKDPLYIYLEENYSDKEVPKEPTEPGGEPVEDPKEPIEEPTETEEEEELGEPEVIKLTEHEYSKEENIDYTPIVDEVLSEHELEPVPEIEVPEPIEPDDDLLKTPEFTDIESALEQAYLEEEERKLQEELVRQRELEKKLMEEQLEGLENGVWEPTEYPLVIVPTKDDHTEEDPLEPPQSDEVAHSEDSGVGEHDYTSDDEKALEGNTDPITDTGSEVDNNG